MDRGALMTLARKYTSLQELEVGKGCVSMGRKGPVEWGTEDVEVAWGM